MSSVSNAVAKRESTGAESQLAQYRNDFAMVLPQHLNTDHWVRVAQGLLRKDHKLRAAAERNPASFLAAMLDCARQGLEPGVTYHLVPFGNEITGIEDYKGLIELIYRAGAVTSVKAEVVYENDIYEFDRDTMDRPHHKPPRKFATKDQRGPMVGAYAYCEMKGGGTSRVVEMAEWEINEHKAVSKTANNSDSMWKKWPRAAWLKTVVKELHKWVPSSPNYMTLTVKAERAGMADQLPPSSPLRDLPPPAKDDAIDEAEVVDEPAQVGTGTDRMSNDQQKKLFALVRDAGVGDRNAYASNFLGRTIASFGELSQGDAAALIGNLEDIVAGLDETAGGDS